MSSALSNVTALYIPPPSQIPSHPSREHSPMLRSERILRQTLERDQNTRLQLHPPTSPPLVSRALSVPANDYAVDSDEDDENVANDSWLENPVRRGRSSSRPKSPSTLRPRFYRTQSSLPGSPPHNKGHNRTRSSTSVSAYKPVNIPRSRTPAPSNSASYYFTPPSPSHSLIRPSSLSNSDSIARARLERALHRDRAKWVQHEPDRHSGRPYRVSRRGSVPRHKSKESDETSFSDPLTPPPSPPFNAQTASRLCKEIEGFVHFSDIEGLGTPPGLTDEELEEFQNNAQKDRFTLFSTWLGLSPTKERDHSSFISGYLLAIVRNLSSRVEYPKMHTCFRRVTPDRSRRPMDPGAGFCGISAMLWAGSL